MNLIWKNIESQTISGLIICELPPITKPKMRTSIIQIDGRDGDIVEDLGYESYTKIVKIGLTKNYDLNKIIKYFTGSGDLILSNEPDKIYKCKIIDKVDYEKLLRFKTATVKFHTQPFKYSNIEKECELEITDETSLKVENIGLEVSKPIITLVGSGTVSITVNNSTVFNYTFPENETEVVIDSQEEEAYFNGVYKNRNMIGIFPNFEPGENEISWSGSLYKIKIEVKSRWI